MTSTLLFFSSSVVHPSKMPPKMSLCVLEPSVYFGILPDSRHIDLVVGFRCKENWKMSFEPSGDNIYDDCLRVAMIS
jgi:hypothetical protein